MLVGDAVYELDFSRGRQDSILGGGAPVVEASRDHCRMRQKLAETSGKRHKLLETSVERTSSLFNVFLHGVQYWRATTLKLIYIWGGPQNGKHFKISKT